MGKLEVSSEDGKGSGFFSEDGKCRGFFRGWERHLYVQANWIENNYQYLTIFLFINCYACDILEQQDSESKKGLNPPHHDSKRA